jgi:hypothetical protein
VNVRRHEDGTAVHIKVKSTSDFSRAPTFRRETLETT